MMPHTANTWQVLADHLGDDAATVHVAIVSRAKQNSLTHDDMVELVSLYEKTHNLTLEYLVHIQECFV